MQGWAGDQNSDLTKNISINSNPISLFEKIFIKQSFNRSPSKENLDNLGEKIAKSLLKAKKKTIIFKIKKISSEKIKLSLIDKKKVFLNLKYFDLGGIKIFGFNGEVFSHIEKNYLKY